MTPGINTLSVAYVLLTALLLVLLFDARWGWRRKAALIVIASLFYFVPYLSWPRLLGWPTVDDLPDRFNVLAMYVQPPSNVTGSKGVIYLWVAERLEGGGEGVPRAFKFGYSVKRHDQMIQVGEKMEKGIAQAGRKKEDVQGPPGRFNLLRRFGQKSADLEFYDAPAPQLPDK
jgi:hypothetical protein